MKLCSPKVLQNKLSSKDNNNKQTVFKLSEFKSTTEGSCAEDQNRLKCGNSIMESYLSKRSNSVQSSSLLSTNHK